jgi:predicted RecB family endonuclease
MLAPTLPDLSTLNREALQTLLLAEHQERTATHQQLLQREQQLLERESEIETLKLLLSQLRRMQFGRKSEKLERQIEQLELRLEDLQLAAGSRENHRDLSCRIFPASCEGETGAASESSPLPAVRNL